MENLSVIVTHVMVRVAHMCLFSLYTCDSIHARMCRTSPGMKDMLCIITVHPSVDDNQDEQSRLSTPRVCPSVSPSAARDGRLPFTYMFGQRYQQVGLTNIVTSC